jgi:hypothetical protein
VVADDTLLEQGKLDWWKHAPRVLGIGAWLVVAVIAVSEGHRAAASTYAGSDLHQVIVAGRALRSGQSLYQVRSGVQFFYPPTAALLGLAASYFRLHQVMTPFAYLETASICLTVFLFRRGLRPTRWQLLGSAIVAALLIKGNAVTTSLPNGNIGWLLILPCAYVVLRWGQGRWVAGGVALAVTLLIKPVLLPLLLIPLLYRKWKSVAVAAAVTCAGFAVMLPFVGDLGAMPGVLAKLSEGKSLDGRGEVNNLSLAALGNVHHVDSIVILLARTAVVGLAIAVVAVIAFHQPRVSLEVVGPLSGVILGAVFLAGSLSESHYLLYLIPGAMTAVAVRSYVARLLLFGAMLTAAYASFYFHHVGAIDFGALQARCVLIELLVFAGCVWALVVGIRGDADDGEREVAAVGASCVDNETPSTASV